VGRCIRYNTAFKTEYVKTASQARAIVSNCWQLARRTDPPQHNSASATAKGGALRQLKPVFTHLLGQAHSGIYKGPLAADSRRPLQPVIPVFSFEETREGKRETREHELLQEDKGYVARLNFEEKTKHRPVAPLKKGFVLFKPDSERVETSFGVVT